LGFTIADLFADAKRKNGLKTVRPYGLLSLENLKLVIPYLFAVVGISSLKVPPKKATL
jgi:hypothetical protein